MMHMVLSWKDHKWLPAAYMVWKSYDNGHMWKWRIDFAFLITLYVLGVTTDTAQPTFAPPIFATMTDVPTFLAFIFPLPFTFTTEDFKDFHLIPFDIPFIDNFELFPFINTRYVLFIFTLIKLI